MKIVVEWEKTNFNQTEALSQIESKKYLYSVVSPKAKFGAYWLADRLNEPACVCAVKGTNNNKDTGNHWSQSFFINSYKWNFDYAVDTWE